MAKPLIATALTAGLMGLAPASYAGFVNFYELTDPGSVKKISSVDPDNIPVEIGGLDDHKRPE